MKNKIEDLRNHLFTAMEHLLDEDSKVDLERIKVVPAVSKQIIEVAKLEFQVAKMIEKEKISGDLDFMKN